MIGYHLTNRRNWQQIRKNGLLPKIGQRSRFVGERKKAVYLFRFLKDIEWMKQAFRHEPMILLKIDIPEGSSIERRSKEIVCYSEIPVEKIEFLKEITE